MVPQPREALPVSVCPPIRLSISLLSTNLLTHPPVSTTPYPSVSDSLPTLARHVRAGLTAALGEVFKQGQRGLLREHVPAAWTIAQKLLASPAAQSSVLARCMVLVDHKSCRKQNI